MRGRLATKGGQDEEDEAGLTLKLLTVCATLDTAAGGGITARTIQLTQALSQAGVDCAILTTHAGRRTVEAPSGTRVISLPAAGGRFRVPWSGLADLRAAVQSADLVLLMNHWTPLNALVFRAIRRFGKPHVVCPGGALPVFGRSGIAKAMYNALFGRRLVQSAAGHIAISRDEIDHFAGYGVHRERIDVIPNAVPTVDRAGHAASFRDRHGLGDAPLLLFLGRLAPIKGPDLLLGAFVDLAGELDGWQLVFAGPDDGMLAQLTETASRSRVMGRVHFLGFLDAVRKQDALAAADLIVVPSRSEAMSIVVLEAAAAGKPVLITDRCGVPEVTAVGGGWIVPASMAGLAGGLREATADRAALRARGEVWRRYALEQFSWPRIARLHLDLFERVLRQRTNSV